MIGKARVRGSVTIFMRTNGFFLFLLSSLLSDMYVLYDSKNFCVWKKFLYFFLKLFIYKRTYIKGFKDNLWLYRSFFILFVKSFVWIIFWISFWMVSKVFPYFSKIFIFSLIFCLTSCTRWTSFSFLFLWCQRFPGFMFNSCRNYTLCVYASSHNTYTFKICVMVIRTHENAQLGMSFKIILISCYVFKVVKWRYFFHFD